MKATEAAYGFKVAANEFVPKGEDSWAYRLVTKDGASCFLKLHFQKSYPPRLFHLPHELIQAGFQQTLAPVSTKGGDDFFEFQGRMAVLLPWLDGGELGGRRIDSDLAGRVGRLMGEFHAAGKLIDWPEREDFGNPFEERLLKVLDQVRKGPHADPLIERFRSLYLPHVDRLEAENAAFNKIGERCRFKKFDFILTHGDPHLYNIVQRANGQLMLIDWHHVKLAPKERDLKFVEENDWSQPAYEGYRQVLGKLDLDPDALEYFRLTWNVGEAMDIGWRMFFTEQDEVRKKFYYEELDHFLDYSGIRGE